MAKTPDDIADIKKGHETRIAYAEKDGQKWATEIRFKGPVKVAKEDLVDYAYVRKLVDQGLTNVGVTVELHPIVGAGHTRSSDSRIEPWLANFFAQGWSKTLTAPLAPRPQLSGPTVLSDGNV